MSHRDWTLSLLDRMVVPDADLYLVGWGHRVPNDLTLETLGVLGRVTRVFAMPPLEGAQLPVESVDLRSLYRPGRPREQIYQEIAELVLRAAQTSPPVAFATFGSAPVGTWSTHYMLAQAPGRGLRTHVSPAISCLEAIWSELPLEPFAGVFIRDATAFLALEEVPPTGVDLLLTQAPALNLQEAPATPQSLAEIDLAPLRDHLLRFYVPDHRVAFVRVTSHGVPARVRVLRLEAVGRSPGDLSTLFVPRLRGAGEPTPSPLRPRGPAMRVDLSGVIDRAMRTQGFDH